MLRDVDGVHEGVGLGADDEDVLFGVVAPQVSCRDQKNIILEPA